MKKVFILGSTGSVGNNTLKVIEEHPDLFTVVGLTTHKNVVLFNKQIEQYKPKFVAITDNHAYYLFKSNFLAGVNSYKGHEGLINAVESEDYDIIVNALVGIAGLSPSIAAIKKNKVICSANKESIVVGGKIINDLLKIHKATLVPIDSEHSALLHLLRLRNKNEVHKIILTASGGPFRGYTKDQLKDVTAKMALRHPTWDMGNKITIDSATLLNKGFEVIEAHNLFHFDFSKIDVIIHKESIIHSLIETVDGEVYAQLGLSDMKFPIQNALTYPDIKNNNFGRLNLQKIRSLTFEDPDFHSFPLLKLAYDCGKSGGTYPTALNAINEIVVSAFLQEKITFPQINEIVTEAINSHNNKSNPSIEDIYESNRSVQQWGINYIDGLR